MIYYGNVSASNFISIANRLAEWYPDHNIFIFEQNENEDKNGKYVKMYIIRNIFKPNTFFKDDLLHKSDFVISIKDDSINIIKCRINSATLMNQILIPKE